MKASTRLAGTMGGGDGTRVGARKGDMLGGEDVAAGVDMPETEGLLEG